MLLSVERWKAGSHSGSFCRIILWPQDVGRSSLALALSLPWSHAEHFPLAFMFCSFTIASRTASLGAQQPEASCIKTPSHPGFHWDPLGVRVMPLSCSPITWMCTGQQGVTRCSWWFDAPAFLGAAFCPSPLWLCTRPTGHVVSNDLSPVSPTLLEASLAGCFEVLRVAEPHQPPCHLSSRLGGSPSVLGTEDGGKQTLLNYAANSEERPDIC